MMSSVQGPSGGISASFEAAPRPIPTGEIVDTVTVDVVVIGAGLAGMVTALSAAARQVWRLPEWPLSVGMKLFYMKKIANSVGR